MSPQPEPQPFFLKAGSTGILMIHGFTGSPPAMRLVGEYLQERGITVSAPLLPGHGTAPEDLNRTTWRDWAGHVDGALTELQQSCATSFVAGQSLGSLLAIHLAANRPELTGAILYSPAVKVADWRIHLMPLVKHVVSQLPKPPDEFTDPQAYERIWAYETYPARAVHETAKMMARARADLPEVRCPVLVIYSTIDEAIHPDSAPYTYEHLGSEQKEIVALHDSGHVLTVDSEWRTVAERTHDFIRLHAPSPV
jgi:carboxylesterase